MLFSRSRIVRLSLCAAVLAGAGLAAGLTAVEPEKKHAAPGHGSNPPGNVPLRVTPKQAPPKAPAAAPHTPSSPKTEPKPAPKREPKPESQNHEEPDQAEQELMAMPTPGPGGPKRPADADEEVPRNPNAILTALREGNTRWVKGRPFHPHADLERRADTGEKGQKPFATLLTCADSRLPVERIFDRGIGDLFVVRVAGNTAGTNEGGSLEYAIEHLKTPVLVIMGHTKCGAVAAALAGGTVEGGVGAIVDQIKPAVDRAKAGYASAKPEELAALAIRENVWQSVFQLLRNSKLLREKAKSGELRVIGAVYNVADGTVDFMGPHPWQSELIAAFEARAGRQATTQAEAPATDEGH